MCNFSDFECSNEFHPSPHAIFETARSKFIQILRQCSMSWKITPLHFLSSNLIYFGQKYPIEVKFLDFWVVGWNFTKFGQLQTSSGKFKKLKFDGLLLSKKNIFPKNTFLQLKHYIQMIYLTLLSTACANIHQNFLNFLKIVIFKIICHFSRHNSSIFF